MIKLRDGLLVQAHMIVAIELSKDNGKPCIDVHTPDGQYWSLSPEEIKMPANELTLTALGNEIDRQCREIGAAGVVSDQVKRAIEQREEFEAAQRPIVRTPIIRHLDDEIPF